MIERGRGNLSLKAFLHVHPGWRVIDYSQMEKWDQCNRKWSYVNINHLVTPPSWDASFSSMLIHPAMSYWYLNKGTPPTADMWHNWWDDYMAKVQYAQMRRSTDAYIFRMEVAQAHFNSYTTRFSADFDMYDFVMSEEVCWATFPDLLGVVWVSKPDVVLSQKIDGRLICGDFKHSKWNINAELINFDRQFLSQAYTTDAQFIMKAHMQTQLESRPGREPTIHLNREFSPVEPDMMTEWLEETQQTCSNILQAVTANIFPKRAPRSCHDFNSVCEFKDLCDLGIARQAAIDDQERQNPLEYLGIESL